MTFMMWLIVGVPNITGILATKFDKIWDYQGYLIFIIALDSIHLNLNDNTA